VKPGNINDPTIILKIIFLPKKIMAKITNITFIKKVTNDGIRVICSGVKLSVGNIALKITPILPTPPINPIIRI